MAYKPIFKTKEQETISIAEGAAKKILEEQNRIRAEEKAKALAEEYAKIKDTPKDSINKIIEDSKKDAEAIFCPTCRGHMHVMEQRGNVLKCTGPGCQEEMVLVPKSADYRCVSCGVPIKRPKEKEGEKDSKDSNGCPFCHGKKAIHYDWSKVWNASKK